MWESIFTKLLILSVQAGFLILATIIIRGILKKIPRKYICLLWCMAALRLLIPVTIESPVSLVPTERAIQEAFVEEPLDDYRSQRAEAMIQATVPSVAVENEGTEYIEYIGTESVDKSGVAGTDVNTTTSYVHDPKKQAPDLRMLMIYLWLFGVVMLLGYGVFTYIRVRMKVRDAVHHEENVWFSDRIDTPFLLGYIKPRIYMPFFVDESRREYIIAHEMGHIRRGDHITKLIGYILLAVYWFQPLVWVAYVLFCKDVEMACDEKVIGTLGEEKKKAYSQTLLLCSVDKHYLLANPLAFGEIDVKKRIANVLSYKKPGVIISIVSVIVLLLAAVLFMTNGQDELPGTTQLSSYQEEYLEMLPGGTKYTIVPLAGAEEPLLLATTDSWKEPVVEGLTETIYMQYCMFDHVGTISATSSTYPVRADEEALYLMGTQQLTVMTVAEGANPETGFPYFEWATYTKEDADYEKMLKKCNKIPLVEFSNATERSPGEGSVLTEAQVEYIMNLKPESRLALIPLAGAAEPMLLSTSGVYYDPDFHSADVSFTAEYCIFGNVGSINTGGTAYPIRADYDGIYLESGHSVTVLTYSVETKQETGLDYLEKKVYSEQDAEYYEVLDRCQAAPVVEFNVQVAYPEALAEIQENISAELEAHGKVETSDAEQQALIDEMIGQLSLQLAVNEEVFRVTQDNMQQRRESFQAQYGTPVRTVAKNNTEDEYRAIAKEMFDEYMKMDNLYSSSLQGESSYLGGEYWLVDMEMLSNAAAVYAHIRSLSTEEMAKGLYNSLFGGEYPLLKEENGKLYTAAFDGFPIQYDLYTEVTLHSIYENEIIYTIATEQIGTEEELPSFFVRCVKEGYNWVVAEYCPVMTQGSHDYYPETVHSKVDMGQYQVVLQDYTTLPGGPLEVAILRDGEKETLSLLYEEWRRDPAKVRVEAVGEIFGYDCFYVYDFGLSHTVTTDFYAVVDGEIKHLATSFGDDPENNTFIRDLNGDGENELICNVTYSADGRQSTRIFKREGDKILCAGVSFELLENWEEYMYCPAYYDAESGKIVVEEWKDNGETEHHYFDIVLEELEFYDYTPGY